MKGTWRQEWRRQAIVGILLLAALTAFSPPSRSEAGTITGTVKDGAEAVIANVVVTAYKIDSDPVTETTATIAADGFTYTLENLAAGTYNLKFSGEGHILEWYEDAPMQQCATPLTVTADSNATVHAVLAAEPELPISITGTVTDSTDAAVEGATVCAYLDDGTGTQPEADSGCATTAEGNGAGKYEIKGLDAGDYKLKITPPSGENLLSEWYEEVVSCWIAGPDVVGIEVVTDVRFPSSS